MDNDDRPVGRVLSRREVLALFGAAGAAALAACTTPAASPTATSAAPAATVTVPVFASATVPAATVAPTNTAAATVAVADATATTETVETTAPAATDAAVVPACIVRPAQTEGPYFVDDMLNRSDIRSDPAGSATSAGVPLVLTLRLAQLNGADCTALAGAQVDIWHCDADGVYSDVGSAAGQQFLRGYQVSDQGGLVTFTTIYPGWYPGRTAHIHFKIRTDPAAAQGTEFTSQLYFDDALSDAVYALHPYNSRGQRTTRNVGDGVYRNGGDQLLLDLTTIEEGYAAAFDIGLQLS